MSKFRELLSTINPRTLLLAKTHVPWPSTHGGLQSGSLQNGPVKLSLQLQELGICNVGSFGSVQSPPRGTLQPASG